MCSRCNAWSAITSNGAGSIEPAESRTCNSYLRIDTNGIAAARVSSIQPVRCLPGMTSSKLPLRGARSSYLLVPRAVTTELREVRVAGQTRRIPRRFLDCLRIHHGCAGRFSFEHRSSSMYGIVHDFASLAPADAPSPRRKSALMAVYTKFRTNGSSSRTPLKKRCPSF